MESQASNEYGLGNLIKEYRLKDWRGLGIVLGAIGAIITILGLGVLLVGINQDTLYLSVFGCGGGGLLLVAGGVFLIISNHNRRRRVLLFDSGFVYLVGQNASHYAWKDIDAVWQKITDVRYITALGMAKGETRFKFTIRHVNGSRVKLNENIIGIAELGAAIQQNVTEYYLPSIVERFQRGETIHFSWISVDQKGLHNGSTQITWPSIDEIFIRSGRLTIRKMNQLLPWYWRDVSEIPNLYVLLTLISQKREIHTKR